MSYTYFWDFLLCTKSQIVPKKFSFDFVVLILNICCFMDVCTGISQKRHFSYIKKQRIFYQIIYLEKNKGFSTKSPKSTFSHKKHKESSMFQWNIFDISVKHIWHFSDTFGGYKPTSPKFRLSNGCFLAIAQTFTNVAERAELNFFWSFSKFWNFFKNVRFWKRYKISEEHIKTNGKGVWKSQIDRLQM